MSGFPILELPAESLSGEPATVSHCHPGEGAGAHLRSTHTVSGYHVEATDGTIGHVCDFLMDNQSWAIRQLVIKTGHRLSGKEMQILTSTVDRISYDDSTVFVNLTKEAIEQNPTHHLVSDSAGA
jgi:hypothetical protein